jgi:hypothetical protein
MKLNEPAPQFLLKKSWRTNRRYRCIRQRQLTLARRFHRVQIQREAEFLRQTEQKRVSV